MKAHPTKYRSVQFRSRLEAHWAAFFDLMDWAWKYEAIELEGYIPDFVLTLPYAPIIVEVKPALYFTELDQYTKKIDESGWEKEALLVGNGPLKCEWDDFALGLLRESEDWSAALIDDCGKCGKRSFHHSMQSFHCRVSGCYDGDHYNGRSDETDIEKIWNEAGNLVQWKPNER
jgi:hypothetical protein